MCYILLKEKWKPRKRIRRRTFFHRLVSKSSSLPCSYFVCLLFFLLIVYLCMCYYCCLSFVCTMSTLQVGTWKLIFIFLTLVIRQWYHLTGLFVPSSGGEILNTSYHQSEFFSHGQLQFKKYFIQGCHIYTKYRTCMMIFLKLLFKKRLPLQDSLHSKYVHFWLRIVISWKLFSMNIALTHCPHVHEVVTIFTGRWSIFF